VSLGLQALDDQTLHFLGRLHDAAEGLAALDVAQRHFARVTFDLIYARPGHTPKPGRPNWNARWRSAPGTCRSIN
jgi:oxygen-independent coproporphyrinogen-3 oxidase